MEISSKILGAVEEIRQPMMSFLREIIAIQSYDGDEGKAMARIREEMERIGFERIWVDPMGNLMGYLGHGDHLIAFDGHVDTVSCGDLGNWTFDPFSGYENAEEIGGLGTTDQKGGVASMLYAGKIMKDLDLLGNCTVLFVCSVQEEDCDGRCWQYIIEEDWIRPEFVVLTEPSDDMISLGQRGRAEIRLTTSGVSAHGSRPELGVHAVYKMGPVIGAIQRLNEELPSDGKLGKGSVAISEIASTAPSRCAVADSCTVILDRRLNSRETPEFALKQLRQLPEVQAAQVVVDIELYEEPSYTGLVYPTEKFYPAWLIQEESPVCESLKTAYASLYRTPPRITVWPFSTNGVSIMGRHQIPCIGYGPGSIEFAHSPDEKVFKSSLMKSCALYASLPVTYSEIMRKRK
ncbi:YgeY family selenium metabolism-linked hydrolase [Proteiniclasticum sp. QWL-01]|uniref:YgeY family selenium metabolism-linked hydrolase n=1 Tax=Proteiniclasticum sp. QWL-01 TaxID=3036945 RepID=UPI00240FC93A|nr:YgeY family selenium metabolism-linked hydrolase [Proteiniclasticum sp. QWL-01]WFF72217.1 YgeY family selenium metabolism-linked hydrolase [Proteiniclasticum sp. QWL-01]